jgi:MFS family permease
MAEVPMRQMAVSAADNEPLSPAAKRTITGAFIGFMVDMYDVYLPIVALTPALIYFQPAHLAVTTATTIFYVVFAVALLGRPIGAFIFGHLADKIGRQRTTMIAVSGFGIATLLIALLPGYQQLGIVALYLLIVLRLVDGVFLGGEYTAASPLAMEYCPRGKRGLYSAIIQAGYPIAFVVISLVTAAMLFLAPAKGLNSPYVQWGWRIPFVVGAVIAGLFLLYYRRVPESESWKRSEKVANPIGSLFGAANRGTFFQVFIVMTGFWLSLYVVVSTIPALLTKQFSYSSTTVTNGLLIANVVLVGGYLLVGVIGQRIGRRTMLMVLGVLIAVVGSTAFTIMVGTAGPNNVIQTMALATVAIVLTVSGWGLLTAYINERFATGMRASGFGIGYSLAVVLPSFYSFYLLGLAHFMPYKYTEVPLLVLGGLLILVGGALGPETNHVAIAATDEELLETAPPQVPPYSRPQAA